MSKWTEQSDKFLEQLCLRYDKMMMQAISASDAPGPKGALSPKESFRVAIMTGWGGLEEANSRGIKSATYDAIERVSHG